MTSLEIRLARECDALRGIRLARECDALRGIRLARECDALREIGSDTTKQLHYFCAAPQHASSEVVKLSLTPPAQRASSEVVKLCLTLSRNCGHAMLLTTIALVATSTHSFLATLLAIALVALVPDSDIETAEAP